MMHKITPFSPLFLLVAMLPLGCRAVAPDGSGAAAAPAPIVASDWRAQTIYRGDCGVWYAHIAPVVDQFASNEVIAADDKGRFLVLSVYSGNWTVHECLCDRLWLAPSRPADVDPRLPGRELYAAGRAGSLHQVTMRPQPFARFTLESREVGHVAGQEFHAVLTGDLSAAPGDELLAFAITGAVYWLRPTADGAGFTVVQVGDAKGRVRDALATTLPGSDGTTVLGVSRRGDLLAMRLQGAELQVRVVLHEDQGLGRITAAAGRPGVYYVTRDDGVLLRVACAADGSVQRQPILATDQGLRGVAAGRFFADGREAVAVYGYNTKVQLVSRAPVDAGEGGETAADDAGEWVVEDIYQGAQKGHWLTVGELDGRNTTDELVAAGFDGEIVLLSRPKGHGLEGVAVPAER